MGRERDGKREKEGYRNMTDGERVTGGDWAK